MKYSEQDRLFEEQYAQKYGPDFTEYDKYKELLAEVKAEDEAEQEAKHIANQTKFELLAGHFLNVLSQACGTLENNVVVFDHRHFSVYEDAINFAVKHNMIKKDQLVR